MGIDSFAPSVKQKNMSSPQNIRPIRWLLNYRSSDFRGDLMAGITVAVMLIPQGMAYAMLAGLPPIYGLYASIVPLSLYPLFGSSAHLSVGPVAVVSLLVLTGVSPFAEAGTSEYIALAILASLIAGVVQLLLGLFRLGFLVNFLSHPVLAGFTSAAAVIIAGSQLKHIFGIQIPTSSKIHEILYGIWQHLADIHLPTVLIGIGGILLILIFKKINKLIPGALIVTVVGIILVKIGGLNERGISIVGDIPASFPTFGLPDMSVATVAQMMPLALAICLISFIESLAIAKMIATKEKTYKVIPNQELIALGLSKIGGAFFQSYPTTGSFSRSAINHENGANTGLASIIAALIVILALLFLTPVFYYLPNAILAAIIIAAILKLVDIKTAKHLWHADRLDFITFILTFLITLFVGIQAGVFSGVIASVTLMIYRNSVPHIAILERIEGTASYRSIQRFENTVSTDNVIIVRFDAQLYFGNAEYFQSYIEQLVHNFKEDMQLLILDFSSISDVDSSGMQVLSETIDFVRANDIQIFIACAIGPIRDKLFKSGLMAKIGEHNQFMKIHDAVTFYENKDNNDVWKAGAIQRND